MNTVEEIEGDGLVSSGIEPDIDSRVRVRLRRVKSQNGENTPDFFAVFPSGEVVEYPEYVPGQKRPREDSAKRSSKKSAIKTSVAASYIPGTPQHAFWFGVERIWDQLEIPTAGER